MLSRQGENGSTQPLRVYRVPVYRKRENNNNTYLAQSPMSVGQIKRYHPQKRRTRIIRESMTTTSVSDTVSSNESSRSSFSPHEQRTIPFQATGSASTASTMNRFVPLPHRARPVFVETPMVERGTSARKISRHKEKTIPLDADRDVYVSDEDYYEESFPDGTYKPKSYKFCKFCHGKCARRCPQCNFCEWYYSWPLCCWLACLFLTIGLLIGIFTLLGFLPEVNSSRRPIAYEQVNTTIYAIQQNLPCDPLTTFNASSTLVRCIDTTPIYTYTVVGQTYSHGRMTDNSYHYIYIILSLFILLSSN